MPVLSLTSPLGGCGVWKRVGVDGEGVPSPCFRAWLVVLVILILMFSLCMMRPADEHSIVKEAQEKKDPAAATACQAVARSKGL
jgi:hypothetical protein